MNTEKLLKLNLQFFSDEEGTEEEEKVDEEELDEEAPDKEEQEDEGAKSEEKDEEDEESDGKETEEERIERLVAERIQAEKDRVAKEKAEKEEQERLKSAEENGDYKEIAENLQKKLAEIEERQLATTKENALIKAGYSGEQAEFFRDRLVSTDEEGIEKEVQELLNIVPVKTYADPSLGRGKNGGGKPEPKGEELGRTLFHKVMGKK